MRLAILAPIQTSLFSRLVTHLAAQEPGIVVTDVIIRTPWTWRRIKSEVFRDGVILVQKVFNKMVLGDKAYHPQDADHILALAQQFRLPGKTLTQVANLHGIRLSVVKDHNDTTSQKILAAAQPDAIIFTGGGLIRRPILQASHWGVINCHTGLLPPFRGMDVVKWTVIENGVGYPGIGLTLHVMDEGVDTGPILLRYVLPLKPRDTFQSIRKRLEAAMVNLVLEGIRGLRDKRITPQVQHLQEGRQYFVMHRRISGYADWRLEQYLLHQFSPHPG
jgi:methionyl-tRNA formyltransferase